jgi:hypothetical protein
VRPVYALYAFVLGLPLHNLVMAELYDAGVRGASLDVVAAWKEALLVAALAWVAVEALRARRLPFRPALVDVLALSFAAVVVLYALIPQDALGGHAGAKAIVFGLRHDLALVAAYFLGRSVHPDLRKLAWTVAGAAAAVAVWGLIDVYAVPLQWWRESGVPGWFRDELGHTYRGLSGLPENFIYNTGDEEHPLRRLVSTFLSPLASSYMFVGALLLLLTVRARSRWRVLVVLAVPIAAGLLWTYARASWAALAVGLLVLALGVRRWWPAAAAVAVIGIAIGFAKAYPHIGPDTSFTASELRYQRDVARANPGASHDPLSPSESSISSHWRNLREGLTTVIHHPQGFGVGNAGATAQRFGVPLQAGESSYTELGVETGLAGLLLFVAWSLALLWSLLRASPVVAAALAAVLALGIQTDVIGVHWLAYCLWWLAGAAAAGSGSPIRVRASFSAVPTLSSNEPSQEGVPQ